MITSVATLSETEPNRTKPPSFDHLSVRTRYESPNLRDTSNRLITTVGIVVYVIISQSYLYSCNRCIISLLNRYRKVIHVKFEIWCAYVFTKLNRYNTLCFFPWQGFLPKKVESIESVCTVLVFNNIVGNLNRYDMKNSTEFESGSIELRRV